MVRNNNAEDNFEIMLNYNVRPTYSHLQNNTKNLNKMCYY